MSHLNPDTHNKMSDSRAGSQALPLLQVMMASTSWPHDAHDWRGRFIFDLQAALVRSGEVDLSLWAPPGVASSNGKTATTPTEAAWLKHMSERGGIAHLLRTSPLSGLIHARGILGRLHTAGLRAVPDVYHVNWLQLALGLPNDGRPVLISVLGSDFGLLRLPGMTALLRRALSRRRAILAPNAEWMAEPLWKRFGDIAEVRPSPFGVNPEWFDVARSTADNSRDWLVVSRITRSKLGDLPAWGAGLFGKARHLHLLGPMQETLELPDWMDQHGATNPKALRETHFPHAAGLLTLSRHDEGRPQVMIEAMAAGLPVIASCIPGHSDLILHGETGWLVGNREELIQALEQAEDPTVAKRIGHQAQAWIREHIGTWDDCAKRCLQAYHDLLEARP
ncbi:MAG TPA: glycosyltransferase family 4 protein [Pseudomonas sp.]|nr:glycosyltransferase family 4 protein [Pseudomonas sp.]